MSRLVKVAQISEIVPSAFKTVEIEGEPIAVFNINGEFYAIQDVCTHDGGILTGGIVNGYIIECPRHGAQFDIKTGTVLRMPAVEPIKTYPVKVEGQEIFVLFE